MKTALKIALGAVVCVVSLVVLLGTIFIPKLVPWAENQVRAAVRRDCKSCDFSMGPVTLAWKGLALGDIWLAGGHKDSQRVEFKVRRIVISPVWTSLLGDHPVIENKSHGRPESALETDKSDVTVNTIFVEDGNFSYVRDLIGTHAVFKVHDINGDIEPNPEGAIARIRAQVGGSGNLNLRVSSPYGKQPLALDADMSVDEQSLATLSEFFKPNAGVELTGTLVKGHSLSKLRGAELTTSLYADYKDFKLKLDKMYDHNTVQTFFTNLGTTIAMREKNQSAPTDEKMTTVRSKREKGESLVSFMLRGLKEASLDVNL
jgi:hypothetical protein